MESLYKQMIKDSPMSYVHIKIIKDNSDNYKKVKIKDMNRSFERIFNFNIKQYIGEAISVEEILTEYEIQEWQYTFNQATEGKKYTIEKYVNKIGAHFNIEIYKFKKDEFYIRLTKICKEVMKLSSILKNSPCFAWIKDRDGVYVDINYTYARYFHMEPEDIIGKTDYYIWGEKAADEFREQDNDIIRENKLCKYEQIVCVNNNRLFLDSNKWPYTGENDDFILGTIGIAMITNDKVELRKNIEKNEQIFKEIANNIEEIIIIRDEKKALYVSPSFEKVYGVTPEELNLYEDMDNWYNYWDSVEFEEPQSEYTHLESDRDVFKVTKKGQDDLWMWSRFAPIFDENGNVIKKVGVVSNITDSKKVQKEIDKMKIDFFANISHELRTPINLILSAIQVIYLRLYNLDKEHIEFYDKYISIINQNGLRLLKLVNNIIDSTKLDSGQFDYTPQNGDIVSCVENICMSVSDFIECNNLTLVFDTDIEEKIVSFDPDNMERIILNLLSNAIKFNKPGGEIKVNIECDENIAIRIKDNGIGISQDKLDKIFERFEQIKSKFKKEREGSGIGLSLVKSLVEIHNGKVSVNSKLGEGTEFIINIPDVIIDDKDRCVDIQQNGYLKDVNKMDLEFSDIYS